MGVHKLRKTRIIGLLFIFGLSIMSSSLLNTNAGDTFPATIAVIATQDDGIVIDGGFTDWANPVLSSIDILEFGNPSNFVTVDFKFAYNDIFLFFYAYIPASMGHVKAMDVHFFGRSDQNDGVHMNAYSPEYLDLAFPDEDVTATVPLPDEDYYGTNDVIATSIYTSTIGSYFEFAKEIRSGDVAGKDIHLEYGNAIAVEFAAWINIYPSDGGPNYGTITETEFRYIRLSVGYDNGDELLIGTPDVSNQYLWVEGEEYQAPYLDGVVTFDGIADEAVWSEASLYNVTLSFQNAYDGTWDPLNNITGEMKLFHDGTNLYISFKIYDVLSTSNDFLAFIIGKSVDMLNYTDGTDFVMISEHGYYDGFLPGDYSEPIPDVDVGGSNDGQANETYVSYYHHVELAKPLVTGDTIGRDWDFSVGDYVYISTIISDDSDQGPNYFELKDVDGKRHFVVHAIKLLAQGEEPTQQETTGNTFTLGFGISDLLIIVLAVTPIIAVIYRKKFKK